MFQVGDISVRLGQADFPLRLTMGGLAELSIKLEARGPADLAEVLRRPTPQQARILLGVLLGDYAALARSLTRPEIAQLMPNVCAVFEQNFGGSHD